MGELVRALLPKPDYLKMLTQLGAELPFSSFDDVFGVRVESVNAFSDYAGAKTDKEARYETFATWIVDWNRLGSTVSGLTQLQEWAGIPERTIDYKGRKDKLKARIIRPYMKIIQQTPGLLVVLAFDKSGYATQRHRDSVKEFQDSMKEGGIQVKPEIGDRLLKAISFLGITGRLLRPHHKVGWVSDNDEIFDATDEEIVSNAMLGMINQVVDFPLPAFGYAPRPLGRVHDLALSVADLAAGVVAKGLPYPYARDQETPVPDIQSVEIIQELAEFTDPFDARSRGTKLFIVLLETKDNTWTPHMINLNRK